MLENGGGGNSKMGDRSDIGDVSLKCEIEHGTSDIGDVNLKCEIEHRRCESEMGHRTTVM